MIRSKKIHFEISERKLLLRFFDIFFVLTALYILGNVFDFDYFKFPSSNFYWAIVLAIYINVFGAIFEMYNLQVASNRYQVLKNTVLTTSTIVLFYLLTPILSPQLPSNRIQLILFYLVVFGVLYSWRMFYVFFLATDRFFQSVLLICDKDQVQELIAGIESVDPHYKIVAYVNTSAVENNALHYVQNIKSDDLTLFVKENGISEILISSQNKEGDVSAELYSQLLHLIKLGKSIRDYSQVYESKTLRIPVQYITKDFYRYFPFSRSNQNKLYLLIVKFFEIGVAIFGLLIGIAFIPFVLLGNAICSRGKLFYTQERVGKDGVVFEIYKFRTMIENAESKGAVFAKTNDSRVTRFGKILRKTRIDEFPQFINILKGDMALIGPRPERPFFVKKITDVMSFYGTRHVVKPGLTGWAQVNYSYGESIDDSLIKLQYDLYYIKHRSIYLDLSIAFKTITTVVFYRGQ